MIAAIANPVCQLFPANQTIVYLVKPFVKGVISQGAYNDVELGILDLTLTIVVHKLAQLISAVS